MNDCTCGKCYTYEDGVDIAFRNGFLTRTIEICLECSYLYVFYCSFGDFFEGVDYENYSGSFEDFSNKESLNEWIEEVKQILSA